MNVHAIGAIYRFEMARTWRTITQSIISPVLSTALYFVVFGSAIGSRIENRSTSVMPCGIGYHPYFVANDKPHTKLDARLVPAQKTAATNTVGNEPTRSQAKRSAQSNTGGPLAANAPSGRATRKATAMIARPASTAKPSPCA